MSVRVFLEEMGLRIGRLSKEGPLGLISFKIQKTQDVFLYPLTAEEKNLDRGSVAREPLRDFHQVQ